MSEEVVIPEEHNENYKRVLKLTKDEGAGTAEKRVPELYWILRNEEQKSPLDSRDAVKNDLIDTFSRPTIDKNFPDEAKDQEKRRAAKIRWERRQKSKDVHTEADAETTPVEPKEQESKTLDPIAVTVGGQQESQPDNPPPKKDPVVETTNEEEPSKEELDEISKSIDKPQTEEELFKTLSKRHDGTHTFWYDGYGIDLFKTREIPQLKNSGVKVFRRLYFEV